MVQQFWDGEGREEALICSTCQFPWLISTTNQMLLNSKLRRDADSQCSGAEAGSGTRQASASTPCTIDLTGLGSLPQKLSPSAASATNTEDSSQFLLFCVTSPSLEQTQLQRKLGEKYLAFSLQYQDSEDEKSSPNTGREFRFSGS